MTSVSTRINKAFNQAKGKYLHINEFNNQHLETIISGFDNQVSENNHQVVKKKNTTRFDN